MGRRVSSHSLLVLHQTVDRRHSSQQGIMSELTEVHDAFARTFKLVEDLRKDTKCQYRTPFLHQALAGGYSGSVFWRAADPARTIIELRM